MGAARPCAGVDGLGRDDLYAVCTEHADSARAAADEFSVTRSLASSVSRIRLVMPAVLRSIRAGSMWPKSMARLTDEVQQTDKMKW
jgi:hypothetical protein